MSKIKKGRSKKKQGALIGTLRCERKAQKMQEKIKKCERKSQKAA